MNAPKTLTINRFNPGKNNFPRPVIPVLPHCLSLKQHPKQKNPLAPADTFYTLSQQGKQVETFVRGRYALLAALLHLNVSREHTVLLPAYHCLSMVDPTLFIGATIKLYSLNHNLSPNIDSVATLLAESENHSKLVVVATHFFGFAQDFALLKNLCNQHQIPLIEDCAHALVTPNFGVNGIGLYGDYLVSSPYKFTACEDGGLLFSNTNLSNTQNMEMSTPSVSDELRRAKHFLFNSIYYKSSKQRAQQLPVFDETLRKSIATHTIDDRQECYLRTTPSPYFVENDIHKTQSRISKWVMHAENFDEISQRRKENYGRWLQNMLNHSEVRPLYPSLPEGTVPYMFPLYLKHPDPVFFWLKHMGVPIWRWDEQIQSDCAIAADYRLHLLHLPCHQDLCDQEMSWMIEAILCALKMFRESRFS